MGNFSKTNITTSIAGTNFVDLTGEARSRGVEFDFSGQLTEYLRLIGNYAYTDTEVTNDRDGSGGNGNKGNQLPNAARHSGRVWATYDFSGLGGQGLSSGAGVFLVGQRQGDSENTFQLPGYATVDAMLKYQRAVGPTNVTVQFNVQNLLDKTHFVSTGGFNRSFVFPGAPRTFIGSVKVEF